MSSDNNDIDAMLLKVIADGQKLKMMDGSLWTIYQGDEPTVGNWLSATTIKIQNTNKGAFSYILHNTIEDISVRAMRDDL